MTSRMQITLDPELRLRVIKRAERQGVSIAEYVRRVIAKDVGHSQPKPDISELFDLDKSKPATSIARDKNKMIAEAIENGRRRK